MRTAEVSCRALIPFGRCVGHTDTALCSHAQDAASWRGASTTTVLVSPPLQALRAGATPAAFLGDGAAPLPFRSSSSSSSGGTAVLERPAAAPEAPEAAEAPKATAAPAAAPAAVPEKKRAAKPQKKDDDNKVGRGRRGRARSVAWSPARRQFATLELVQQDLLFTTLMCVLTRALSLPVLANAQTPAQPASLSSLNAARAAAGLKPGQLDPGSALVGTRPKVGGRAEFCLSGTGNCRPARKMMHLCGTSSCLACKAGWAQQAHSFAR